MMMTGTRGGVLMNKKDESISVKDLRLDVLCERCNGTGDEYGFSEDSACNNCEGTGYATTSEGDALMKFVRRHLLHYNQ